MPEMGEQLVASWLTWEKGCSAVMYGVRLPGWSFGELDVLGFHFETREAWLCEATTHIGGLGIGASLANAYDTLSRKHDRQREYAATMLDGFAVHYMLWAPRIGPTLMTRLTEIDRLQVIANQAYTAAIAQLRSHARRTSRNTGNDAFRVLQILEHLR